MNELSMDEYYIPLLYVEVIAYPRANPNAGLADLYQ